MKKHIFAKIALLLAALLLTAVPLSAAEPRLTAAPDEIITGAAGQRITTASDDVITNAAPEGRLTAAPDDLLTGAGAGNTDAESADDAAPTASNVVSHTVVKGDTMWKLAVRYEVGLSEIIAANPHIKDPHWIYPGDILYIPLTDSDITDYESEVIRLVNEIRRQYGLGTLKANWQLSRVARYKSQDMHDRGYFSHTSPTYGSPFQMMKSFGISYRTAGENIAKGYATPKAVVDGWMNSEGHRANILNASFTEIGVGYVADGRYWTQMFIG